MEQVDLSQYFKMDKIQGHPLNRPKDIAMRQKINQEMLLVRRKFDELSAKSIIATRHLILRNGR